MESIGQDIDGEAGGDESGTSVSLSADGTIVAIGAYSNRNSRGHTRIYQFSNENWNQLGTDIDGEKVGDKSGYSVSLSADGTIVAIGAYMNNGNGTYSGHTRIYKIGISASELLDAGFSIKSVEAEGYIQYDSQVIQGSNLNFDPYDYLKRNQNLTIPLIYEGLYGKRQNKLEWIASTSTSGKIKITNENYNKMYYLQYSRA